MSNASRVEGQGLMDWSKEYDYALFKYQVFDDSYYLLPINELPACGFSSLYYVTRSTASTLESSGFASYKGDVWAPSLWIDFDTESGAVQARGRLAELGLAYKEWTTGNRGAHFEIPRPHSPSHLLPKLDKYWVADNFPEADLTIYLQLHLFRLPGARHEKTGKIKKIVNTVQGSELILGNEINKHLGSNFEDYMIQSSESIFVSDSIMSATVPYQEGERHNRLLVLGVMMKKQGEPMEFIARWLYHANLLSNPLGSEELAEIVNFVARTD